MERVMQEKGIDVFVTVSVCANEVHRRFREYVERDDLVQEGHLWVAEHAGTVNAYLNDEDVKRARYRLRRDVMTAMERYARTDKASSLGYSPEDEQFYSEAAIAKLIEMAVLGITERKSEPDTNGGAQPQKSVDNGDGKDVHILVMDVRTALGSKALTDDDRRLLWSYHGEGKTMLDIAEASGVDRSTISRRLHKITRKVMDALGGPTPWLKATPEPDENRPGVHSNRSGVNQHVS